MINQPACSRIYRFLVSPTTFMAHISGIINKTLQSPTSDHYPICLQADGIQRGPIPFRLDNRWLSEMKSISLIGDVRTNIEIHGNASFIFVTKSKEVNVIKVWTKEEKLKEGEAFTSIMQEINKIDLLDGEGVLDEAMMGKRNNLEMDLANLCKADEIF